MITNKLLTTTLFLSFFCTTTLLNAQDEFDDATYNQIWGLNVTGFANQFLSFNSVESPQGPYLITYKKVTGDKAFRMGFGANVLVTTGEDGNSFVPFEQTVYGFDLRLGSEKRHNLSKRWLFTTGIDGLVGVNHTKFESFNNFGSGEQKSTSFLAGVGPALGIHFRISNRVSIGTESSIYLTYSHRTVKSDDGFSGSDDTDKNSITRLDITPPFALFLSMRI